MNIKTWLLFFFILQPALLLASSSEDLKVEGILYDDGNKDNSVAMVNGNFLKKGDTYAGYKVLAVNHESLRLADEQTGKESNLEITGGPSTSVLPDLKSLLSEEKRKSHDPHHAEKSNSNPLSHAMNYLQEMTRIGKAADLQPWRRSGKSGDVQGEGPNPLIKFFGLFWEMRAIIDIRTVYLAACAYYLKTGTYTQSMEALVGKKFLPKVFAGGVNGQYRFRMEASPDHVAVYADPVQTELDFKHFYIDEDGTIRLEKGKPASENSPVITPANVIGWSPKK